MSTTRSPAELQALLTTLREFIASEVIPQEEWGPTNDASHDAATLRAKAARLAQAAQARGLGPPRQPAGMGGLGLSWEECCPFLEEAGRSFLGPSALGCAPPTQPDIVALDAFATPAQRSQYLAPLARGDKRSCFAMTEPAPGVGSDPQMITTTARRNAQGWVIDGHKWFITGAMHAHFAIVVARTEAGVSWFLVDTDAPGFELVRDVPTMEPFHLGGHGEIRLTQCQVGPDALLGVEGRGLDQAQLRLEGARLFHCMRFIGLAARAIDTARDYAAQRQSKGVALAEHQMVQAMVADAHIELYAARLMVLDVARRLDAGESIRHVSSMAKVFVSEAVNRVADSAVQITGALGISEDLPLSMILRMLRPFRIYDGASEVHRTAIARRVFNHRLPA